MANSPSALVFDRPKAFCERFGLKIPILLAPMSGACPASLSIAVANAGGAGACGVLMMSPEEIKGWVEEFRAGSRGPLQLNTWVPDPAPARDFEHEARLREFLATWGPSVPSTAGDQLPPDFTAQCEAMLAVRPTFVSSIMGLFPKAYVRRLKEAGVSWLATVTTVEEAKEAEAAGADALVAQGAEAGGHRGSFRGEDAEGNLVGLFSLLPAVVDAVGLPVVAAGGIADGRAVAAAFLLGASAVEIGTGFLRCPEARIDAGWADAIGRSAPEQTRVTRAFSGRPGRSLATEYVKAAMAPEAPRPAPYPVQRGLTSAMRAAAQKTGDFQRMQAWAGQSGRLAKVAPAAQVVQEIWSSAQALLGAGQ